MDTFLKKDEKERKNLREAGCINASQEQNIATLMIIKAIK